MNLFKLLFKSKIRFSTPQSPFTISNPSFYPHWTSFAFRNPLFRPFRLLFKSKIPFSFLSDFFYKLKSPLKSLRLFLKSKIPHSISSGFFYNPRSLFQHLRLLLQSEIPFSTISDYFYNLNLFKLIFKSKIRLPTTRSPFTIPNPPTPLNFFCIPKSPFLSFKTRFQIQNTVFIFYNFFSNPKSPYLYP